MHNQRLGHHSMERSVRATKDRIVIGPGRLQHDGHRHAVKKLRMERLDFGISVVPLGMGMFGTRARTDRKTSGTQHGFRVFKRHASGQIPLNHITNVYVYLMLPLECSVGLFDVGPQLCSGLFQNRRGLGRRTGGAEQ